MNSRLSHLVIFIILLVNYSIAQTGLKYWSPEQCLKMKNVTAVRVSPDGKKVAYTIREAIMTDERSEYVNQVYLSNSDGTNSFQLTRGDKNNSNPKWSPDGKLIAFTSNRDGKINLYILPTIGGESEKITDVKTGVNDFEWRHDGKAIAFTMADLTPDAEEKNKKAKNDWYFMEEDVKQNRLYVLWLDKRDSGDKRVHKQLTKENRNVNAFSWSPDGTWIAYSHGFSPKVNDNVYSDISMVEVETGEVKKVINTSANETNPQFSPDGKWIAFVSSEDPVIWAGKNIIKVIGVQDGKSKSMAETPNAGAGLLGWSSDGKHLYITEANKTLFTIYRLSVDGKELQEFNKVSKDYISGASLNSTRTHLGFLLQNTSKPTEGYITSVAEFLPVRITNTSLDFLKNPVPKTEVVRWKSSDGKEIEGLLTYPLNYKKGQKVPFLLNVHGGPAGVFSQTFLAGNQTLYPIAAFAELGYAVLRPNPRGSTGYGVEFRRANERDWGGGDYNDLMAGVDHVINMGIADPEKLGVMGWSYGGFMSSWIVAHTERFKAASIGAPVVDLVFQNLTDDISGFLPSYMKNDPWDDYDIYNSRSPLRFVQNVKTPVLLQHGEADIRVPFSQAVMFFNALKRKGVPVRLLALPRQPHGPIEPKMVLKVMQSNLEWFQKYFESPKGF